MSVYSASPLCDSCLKDITNFGFMYNDTEYCSEPCMKKQISANDVPLTHAQKKVLAESQAKEIDALRTENQELESELQRLRSKAPPLKDAIGTAEQNQPHLRAEPAAGADRTNTSPALDRTNASAVSAFELSAESDGGDPARSAEADGGGCDELLEVYDRIGRSKRIGFQYSRNEVTEVAPGLQAEREGVHRGWRIREVNGTAMPRP